MEYVSRHVAPLQMICREDGELRNRIYSGFFLERPGTVVWVTAGHCILEIKELVHNSDAEIRAMRWFDQHETVAARAIPVDHHRATFLPLLDAGHDIGFISPSGMNMAQILANPNFAGFDEQSWSGNSSVTPDGYYVLGYPTEGRKEEIEDAGSWSRVSFETRLACLCTSLALPADYRDEPAGFWNRDGCLYGEVSLDDPEGGVLMSSIQGMSGGPVLSVERSPKLETVIYRLVGAQASWLPDSRIVRVEPIGPVVAAIDMILSEYRKWLNSRSGGKPDTQGGTQLGGEPCDDP